MVILTDSFRAETVVSGGLIKRKNGELPLTCTILIISGVVHNNKFTGFEIKAIIFELDFGDAGIRLNTIGIDRRLGGKMFFERICCVFENGKNNNY